MKPIEPGCLVLIYGLTIHTRENGKSGVAVKTVQPGDVIGSFRGIDIVYDPFDKAPGWLVYGDFGDEYMPGKAVFREKNLIRIDGHEERQKEREAETC